MDKGSISSGDSTAGNGIKDQYLKHLNKLSHKISKPIIKKPSFDPPNQNQTQIQNSVNHTQPPANQQQPPVYNISKNNFRDMVQKLTGSQAHKRISSPTPIPINPPKSQNSRLQKIRPPPLAYVSNNPPSLLPSSTPPIPPPNTAITNPNNSFGRFVSPLSPLPPLPSVHAAAESPISAYMRYLKNSTPNFDSNSKQFSGLTQQSQLHFPPPPPPPQLPPFQLPSAQIPFGCLSPRSPYPLHPSLLFSSSSGQLGFPLSPTVPATSPR